MLSTHSQLMISVPYGMVFQNISSPRYSWNNHERGNSLFVILQWTLEGEGLFEYAGETHPVPKGSAFIALVPEPTKYYYSRQANEPWQVGWVNLYGPLAMSLCRLLREEFGPVLPLSANSAAGVMVHKLAESAETRANSDPHETSVAAYAFLMEWLRQLTLPRLEQADPVQAALALCAARFREPLGVKELAAQTGLSREHFTRIFTEQTGNSPARHLRELRLAAAQRMMRRASVPLAEVAMRCGFPSVRSLRQALGQTAL